MYFFKEINEIDYSVIYQVQEIETEAFGEGAMNEWFLVPFIRYGKVYVLMNSDGEVVASAEYMRDFSNPQMAYLFALSVKQPLRGQGLGTKLMQKSLAKLKEEGIELVKLTVGPENGRALRLYRKLGFIQAEFCPNEYGQGEDRLVLQKQL